MKVKCEMDPNGFLWAVCEDGRRMLYDEWEESHYFPPFDEAAEKDGQHEIEELIKAGRWPKQKNNFNGGLD